VQPLNWLLSAFYTRSRGRGADRCGGPWSKACGVADVHGPGLAVPAGRGARV